MVRSCDATPQTQRGSGGCHNLVMKNIRGLILCIFSFVVVCLAAGVVYGWPALRQQLIADGSTLSEQQLGAAFTVGAWSTQGCRFLTGLARDRFGTRIVTCFCMVAAAMGFLGIALLDVNNIVSLMASMFVLGLGAGTQLCVQPVASLFPSVAGSILASLSGAFQISGLVFLALTSTRNRLAGFVSFCFVLLGFAVVAFFLLPLGVSFVEDSAKLGENGEIEQIERVPGEVVQGEANDHTNESQEVGLNPAASERMDPEQPDSGIDTGPDDEKSTNEKQEQIVEKSEERATLSEQVATTVEQTAWQQIRSLEYALLLSWFSILIFPLQYYIGSIGFQLEQRGDDTGFYAKLFSILYASSAVLAPAIGYLADRIGVGIVQGLATVLASASFFILATDAPLNMLPISLACNGLGRMFVYGMFFTHIGKRLGYRNYGTLAGLGLLISAIVSLLQYPLIAAAAEGQARVVNLCCGSILLTTLPYCFWLARKERN